jgi:hypothetical protein
MTTPQKKRNQSNTKTKKTEKCLLKSTIVKKRARNRDKSKVAQYNKDYWKRVCQTKRCKEYGKDYRKRNAGKIKKRVDE